MQKYEIRVLNDDLTTRVIIEQQFFNDTAAARSAKMFAEPHQFEVWRGLTCISGFIRARPAPQPSNGPAA